MDFEIRDAESHHNVCRRMRAREHILYFFAAFDIPVRNIVFFHRFFHFRFQSPSFSDAFHCFERKGRFPAAGYEIIHNIIACADDLHKVCNAVIYERFGIIEPDIRSVGKP